MKKILLFTTGGTISCSGFEGLSPQKTGEELLQSAGIDLPGCEVDVKNLFSIDSTEVQPFHWTILRNAVLNNMNAYNGFVITHGTDTLAYTSSMLSYLCGSLSKPVVLTGSQRTLDEPNSDAPVNLRDALLVALSGLSGVFAVFGGRILLGPRTHKADTQRLDGFTSINYPVIGTVENGAVKVAQEPPVLRPVERVGRLDAKIAVVSVSPGTPGDILDGLKERGIQGVILRGYGAGGLPEGLGWLESAKRAVGRGLTLLMTTQSRNGRVDLERYRVGIAAREAGVLSGHDMTLEAAYTKLLWIRSITDDPNKIQEMLQTSYCGEVTL